MNCGAARRVNGRVVRINRAMQITGLPKPDKTIRGDGEHLMCVFTVLSYFSPCLYTPRSRLYGFKLRQDLSRSGCAAAAASSLRRVTTQNCAFVENLTSCRTCRPVRLAWSGYKTATVAVD